MRQVFGFDVPAELPGVPAKVLNPRDAWSDKADYDATRTKLADMFKNNFIKFVKVRSSIYLFIYLFKSSFRNTKYVELLSVIFLY